MQAMNLAHALRLDDPKASGRTVSLAGSGGKTTVLFQLARELDPPVIVTSTTHFGAWQVSLADRHIVAGSPGPIEELEHGLKGVILVSGPIEGDRTTPTADSLLVWLRDYCGYHDLPLLIEADGSRQRPLKAPAEHEPAIPAFTEHSLYIAGLSGLGHPLTDEFVHRPEIFARLSGLNPGELITPDALARVLTHPQGGLKNIPPASTRTLILNQADSAELQSQAGALAPALLNHFESVIVSSFDKEPRIHAVHEKTAGIILAAGESSRFGQPKQLLDWRGEPFVRAVARTASAAGLSPVILVTGANAEPVEDAVNGMDVYIARNEDWKNGQSSSIRAGLLPLSSFGRGVRGEGVGAAIFLLADQPQVGADVLRALMEVHARGLYPIVAPLVLEERRANPVLFDRVTFPDLMKIEGDVGGRSIFSKHKVEYMPWHDDKLLLDVDKPEDYQRLSDMDSNVS